MGRRHLRKITLLSALPLIFGAACSQLEALEAIPTTATASSAGTGGSTDSTLPTNGLPGTEDTVLDPADYPDLPRYSGELGIEIVNSFNHDSAAYTEGLAFHDHMLYESTGLLGASSRRQLDPTTGAVINLQDLDSGFFANGLAIDSNAEIGFNATSDGQALVLFDVASLREFDRVPIDAGTIGVCIQAEALVVANASDGLQLLDPMSFLPVGTIKVTEGGVALPLLSELECVGDQIWAVIWNQNRVVQIGTDGAVTAWADLSALVPEGLTTEESLSAITYRPETGTFYVTGRLWPELFEIRFTGTRVDTPAEGADAAGDE